MRVHMMQYRMTMDQADALEYYLGNVDGVTDAEVNERTGNAVIRYSGERDNVIHALALFDYEAAGPAPERSGRELMRAYKERVAFHIMKRVFTQLLPMPLRHALLPLKAIRYLLPGVRSILSGSIDVSVLDATSIAVSLLRGDYETPSSVMFLLGLSEILEEWTHKKSVDDLARSMALNVDKVWLVVRGAFGQKDGEIIICLTGRGGTAIGFFKANAVSRRQRCIICAVVFSNGCAGGFDGGCDPFEKLLECVWRGIGKTQHVFCERVQARYVCGVAQRDGNKSAARAVFSVPGGDGCVGLVGGSAVGEQKHQWLPVSLFFGSGFLHGAVYFVHEGTQPFAECSAAADGEDGWIERVYLSEWREQLRPAGKNNDANKCSFQRIGVAAQFLDNGAHTVFHLGDRLANHGFGDVDEEINWQSPHGKGSCILMCACGERVSR